MFSIFQAGYSGLELVAVLIAFVFSILIGLGFHEWGHAVVADSQGDMTPRAMGRLTLNPLAHLDFLGSVCLLIVGFGWAKPVPINPLKFKNWRKSMLLVSLAGVFVNFVLMLIFSFLFVWFSSMWVGNTFIEFLLIQFAYYMTLINFTLMIFNLLPIYPLDGYQAVRSLVRFDNQFFKFMEQYGMIVMVIFLISPLFELIFSGAVNYILNPLIDLWCLLF